MTPDSTTLQVSAVLFLATFVRSAFGFGEALIAVPLLALLMPIEVAAPVAVLVSITVAAVVVVQDWREVHVRSAAWLLAFTLIGTPLGLLILTAASGGVLEAMLAVVIIAFSTYSLLGRRRAELRDDRLAWLFGLVAGVLGGAYGINGPPLVVYGTLRRWSPQHFRATLQGYFLPASVAVMIGYWFAGLWVPVVTTHYVMALPAVVIAIFVGRWVNRRMSGSAFFRYAHAGLIVIGVVLLVRAAGEREW